MPPQIDAARPGAGRGRGRPSTSAGGARGGSRQATFKPPRPQTEKRLHGRDSMERDSGSSGGSRNKNGGEVDINDHRGIRVSGSSKLDEEEEEDDDDEGRLDESKAIPPALTARLLHQFFQKPNTRITQDANAAIGKYMEIFIREAVARSVAERRDGGFLDVDVLQKTATQLVMDM